MAISSFQNSPHTPLNFHKFKKNPKNLLNLDKKPNPQNLKSFWAFLSSIFIYVSIFYTFNLSPSALFFSTKFWFFISNTLVLIIAADYSSFSSSKTHDYYDEYVEKSSKTPLFDDKIVFEKTKNIINEEEKPNEKIENMVDDHDQDEEPESLIIEADYASFSSSKTHDYYDEYVEKSSKTPLFDDKITFEKTKNIINEEEKPHEKIINMVDDRDQDEEPEILAIKDKEESDPDPDPEDKEESDPDPDPDPDQETGEVVNGRKWGRSKSDVVSVVEEGEVVLQRAFSERQYYEEDESEFSRMSNEELNGRVEEFIRRFNRQIRLQAVTN